MYNSVQMKTKGESMRLTMAIQNMVWFNCLDS